MGILANPFSVHWIVLTLSVTSKLIYRHNQAKYRAHPIPRVSRYISENYPGRKYIHPVFQTEDSRFGQRTSCYMWYTHRWGSVTMMNVMSQKSQSLLFILFIISKFLYMLISQVTTSSSWAIVKDPFPINLTSIRTYFYVLHQYSTYSQRRGSVGYPHQGSIKFHMRFHWENLKRYSYDSSPPKVSRYFYTLVNVPQNSFLG